MAIYQYGERIPQIGSASYVSDTAVVIGDVVIGDGCYIGHGAILRGDYGSIKIRDGTASCAGGRASDYTLRGGAS